ncbi:MAG: response regulator transcription factor [Lentimicrobium sp.]|jgi:DNA-binding NarL/FixJ family response regulator|uniref:Oxygen regulatory protein NreC n=1 Tax=bioreactor metagenome TaxID=1076179 RepID=A0A644V0S6_9ZZZZ|nr:response regulator transcription factor [Lentimicrobium sp.]MCO5256970.1 response regulator transcription factor [Lentimicrobium sp.]MCO5261267.1 response regulator transcription factor [Lentimicrobium sp.]MEA5110195.1 response regulator transcription factor [Lentimicrobium sp.]HPG32355.1 response regulator transcription factor [Lentimicrobium sp.]
MNIKVAIVDDHRIVRDGLKAILRGMNGYEIVYEAADGARLKSIPQNIAPDLVLLDIGLPDVSGLDLIEFIKQQLGSRILVLTAEMDEEIICTSLERGADGFMNKDASGDELLRAMDAVVQGEPYFGQNLSSVIYRSYKRKINELKNIYGMPALTDREREIIQALGDGLSFKEIGARLFISPRTVENHKTNILEKLGLKNTIELVKYAIRHKIILLE